MSTLTLPNYCGPGNLASVIDKFTLEHPQLEEIEVVVSKATFIPPQGLAILGAWLSLQKEFGSKILFRGDRDVIRYLSRMDLMQHLSLDPAEDFDRYPDAGRLVTLRTVRGTSDVVQALDAIVDMIVRQFDEAKAFLPALEWAATELMDNMFTHSEARIPGVVCAQYYPKQNSIDIGICDMGRGIQASLKEAYPALSSHHAAIELALQAGVTRNKSVGKGNGLAGTLAIAKANQGSFQAWSGDARYSLKQNKEQWVDMAKLPGTGVWLAMDTRNPVDLTQTYLGHSALAHNDNESTILNRIENDACDGGILIRHECKDCQSCEGAIGIRRKVLAIFANGPSTPVVLDFQGVTEASDDFLDHFIGELVDKLGVSTCKKMLRVNNLEPSILGRCDTMIQKRQAVSLGGWRVRQVRDSSKDYFGQDMP